MRTVFIFALYRILLVAATPFLLAYVLYRSFADERYLGSLRERLGFWKPSSIPTVPGGVWLHAVSVGEILSSVALIKRLRSELRTPVYVSVSTIAGRAIAEEKLAGIAEAVFYAPLDYVFTIRRILRRVAPAVVVVMETEIWPNLYREAKRFGCGLLVVNGRISDRAMPRYTAFRRLFGPVLSHPDRFLVQSENDAARYVALGTPAERVEVAGNLKYDFDPAASSIAPEIRAFLERNGSRKVWIAASTMPPADANDLDEDDVVIRAFQRLAEDVLLILVPRKPDRFEAAAAKLRAAGVPFVRRSELPAGSGESASVLLLDSMGELSGLFAIADVVFMGGTLARRGGHNILEPAFFGCPVIVGPHMENFAEISRQFSAVDACVRVESAPELGPAVERLFRDEPLRRSIGLRARAAAESQRGATTKAMEAIREAIDSAIPSPRRSLAARLLLRPLARIWAAGAHSDRRRKISRQQRLSTPVISVGGLSMGGAGKTPLVAFLAQALQERGINVAILTRGYRRQDAASPLLIERGTLADVRSTGDEAQIFVRAGTAHIGVGADRYAVGRAMEERFHPDVFLLDDGFQHARLHRDLDIVVIDSTDPFGGGVFPEGNLREPPSALQRAGAIVLSRTERGRSYTALERMLRLHNAAAPIYRSSIVPLSWNHIATGQSVVPDTFAGQRVAAFCGLANPPSFRRTLFDLSIQPVCWLAFDDHHRYSPGDLEQIFAAMRHSGAQVVLTTEKDAVKIPPGAGLQGATYYLLMQSQVEEKTPALGLPDSLVDLIIRSTGRRSTPIG